MATLTRELESGSKLSELCQELAREPFVALDTEFKRAFGPLSIPS